MDYQLQVLGKQQHESTAQFAAFMASFGVACNSVSLAFSLVGTSFVIRRRRRIAAGQQLVEEVDEKLRELIVRLLL